MQALVAEIIADLLARTTVLENRRHQSFFKWLQAHHQNDRAISQENLGECLTRWFELLSPANVLRENSLILREISWWRDLDQRHLARIIGAEQ